MIVTKKQVVAFLSFAFLLVHTSYAASPFVTGQVWKGSYDCKQGETKLTLRVNKVAKAAVKTELGDAVALEAVFDFDYNNRSIAGAYRMTGNYYPDSKVATFDPKSWIRQPTGFEMVGLDGTVSNDGKSYGGKIVFHLPVCSSFEVELQQP